MHRFQRWREVLQGAHTSSEVELIMRDYVNSLPPGTIEVLPEECRRVLSDPDISAAAVVLLHCEMTAKNLSPEVVTVLHEIAHTFAAASVRLRYLPGASLLAPQAD